MLLVLNGLVDVVITPLLQLYVGVVVCKDNLESSQFNIYSYLLILLATV